MYSLVELIKFRNIYERVRLQDRTRNLTPFNYLTDIFLFSYRAWWWPTGAETCRTLKKARVEAHASTINWILLEDIFNSHGTRENKNIFSLLEAADLPGKSPCNLKDINCFGSICCSHLQSILHVISILLNKTAGSSKRMK